MVLPTDRTTTVDRAPLTPEVLLRRFAASRRPADLEALVLRYRPLARSLARRYAGGAGDLEDLEQVACLALVKAIKRFEPSRGNSFTTFAVPTIVGELKRYLRDHAWVAHVPRPVKERARAVRAAAEQLSAAGHVPTAGVLAARLECSQEDVVEALCAGAARSTLSLDAGGGEDEEEEGLSALERLGTEDPGYALVEDRCVVEDALPALAPAEQELLRLRFAEELNHREIAARLGMSASRVSRGLEGALDRLATLAAA